MLGRTLQGGFVRIYVLLILNLLFWGYTAVGLVIGGVGPALRTISELFAANEWNYQGYSLKESWRVYKQVFWAANREFWLFGVILAVLLYNLYLSTQLTLGWMVFVQLVLGLAILMTVTLGMFTLSLQSHYDVTFKLAVKLAVAEYFQNLMALIVYMGGVGVLILVSIKLPGLIPFISIAALVTWTHSRSRQWFDFIDAKLAE